MSFTHVTVGTNDLSAARSFYDQVLAALGWSRVADLGDNGSIWGAGKPAFFALKPANGEPASVGNGVTVSFEAPSRAAVKAFHEAALALGAEPGDVGQLRPLPGKGLGLGRELMGVNLPRDHLARDAHQLLLVLDQAQADLLLRDLGVTLDRLGLAFDFLVAQVPEGRNDGGQEQQHRDQGPERGQPVLA